MLPHTVQVLCCLVAVDDLHCFELQVENNPHCREVLGQRIADGSLPNVPVYTDVWTFRPTVDMRATCTGLIAGFPCQDS